MVAGKGRCCRGRRFAIGARVDITRNLFYSFRGSSITSQAAPLAQLENNLTKSLLTVLERCSRRVFLKAFLDDLGLPFAENVFFSLQRGQPLAASAKRRIVLSITGDSPDIEKRRTARHKGRPDAWICSGGWAVLVESKIGKKLSLSQLESHAKAAGWGRQRFKVIHRTWMQMHRLVRSALDSCPRKDAVSHLLAGDWLAYMERQNMIEFTKITVADFDFLNQPPEQRKVALSHIRGRMRDFARYVSQSQVSKKVAGLYRGRRVKDWKYGDPDTKSTSYWFNVGGEVSKRTWHITVFYRPNGIDVEVLASQAYLSRRLCKAGVDHLRQIVSMASKDREELGIGCRRAWYANPKSSYKGSRIAWSDEPVMVKPSTLSVASRDSYAWILRDAIQGLQGRKHKEFRPELIIRKSIPRDEIISRPLKGQVALVRRAIQQLYPLLKYLMEATKK